MGRRTWNYSVGIKVTKYKEYLKMMLGTHLGFLVFLLVYAFIENCVGWMMGTYHSETIPSYNMSGLLLMALDVFMAYFIGFFEEFSFSLYVSKSRHSTQFCMLLKPVKSRHNRGVPHFIFQSGGM